MGPFGLVKVECASDGVEHGLGYSLEITAFQPGVIVDTDPGEQGNFFAA
jgi:hypothetical protein